MLGKYNKKWHDNAIMFLCIFTMIISLYSLFNLSGFFVADFFKNKIISALFYDHNMFFNILKYPVGVFISLFFLIKVEMSILILTVKTNSRKLYSMFILVTMSLLEGVLSIGGYCGNRDGTAYPCAFDYVVNQHASLIIVTFTLTLIIKQIIIVNKEKNDLEKREIETRKTT